MAHHAGVEVLQEVVGLQEDEVALLEEEAALHQGEEVVTVEGVVDFQEEVHLEEVEADLEVVEAIKWYIRVRYDDGVCGKWRFKCILIPFVKGTYHLVNCIGWRVLVFNVFIMRLMDVIP